MFTAESVIAISGDDSDPDECVCRRRIKESEIGDKEIGVRRESRKSDDPVDPPDLESEGAPECFLA
jgi:hypothetical protein